MKRPQDYGKEKIYGAFGVAVTPVHKSTPGDCGHQQELVPYWALYGGNHPTLLLMLFPTCAMPSSFGFCLHTCQLASYQKQATLALGL